jgi:hypothetical protein
VFCELKKKLRRQILLCTIPPEAFVTVTAGGSIQFYVLLCGCKELSELAEKE